MRAVGGLLTLLSLFAFPSVASAKIKYCNDFKYDLHIALAYETDDGFTSEGWTGVKANSCWEDDKIAGPLTFYYHAETDAIPDKSGGKTVWNWGNRRAFSVINTPFKITHAEFKAKDGRFAEFSGPYTLGAATDNATITFAEGTSSVSLSNK